MSTHYHARAAARVSQGTQGAAPVQTSQHSVKQQRGVRVPAPLYPLLTRETRRHWTEAHRRGTASVV